MSQGESVAGMADGLSKETGGDGDRRSAARRTAWLVAALALGFYLLFYFLGPVR